MTGRRFHRTTEAIPRRPWKAKSPFASKPTKISINWGTQGVRTRYGTVLLPFIPIVRSPGRPVILVPDKSIWRRRGSGPGVRHSRSKPLQSQSLSSGLAHCNNIPSLRKARSACALSPRGKPTVHCGAPRSQPKSPTPPAKKCSHPRSSESQGLTMATQGPQNLRV